MNIGLWSTIIGYILFVLIIFLNSWEVNLLRRTQKKPIYERILLSLSVCDIVGGLLGFISYVTITCATFRGMRIFFSTLYVFHTNCDDLLGLGDIVTFDLYHF